MLRSLLGLKNDQKDAPAQVNNSAAGDVKQDVNFDDAEVVNVGADEFDPQVSVTSNLAELVKLDYFKAVNTSTPAVTKVDPAILSVAPLASTVSAAVSVVKQAAHSDAKNDVPAPKQSIPSAVEKDSKTLPTLKNLVDAPLSKKEFADLRSILFEKITSLVVMITKNWDSIDPVLLKSINKQCDDIIVSLAQRKIDKAKLSFDSILETLKAYQFDFSHANNQIKKNVEDQLEKIYDKLCQVMESILHAMEKNIRQDKAGVPYEFLGILTTIPVFEEKLFPFIIASPVLFSKLITSINYLELFCSQYPKYENQVIKMVMNDDELFKSLFTGTFHYRQFLEKFDSYKELPFEKLLSKNSFAFFKQTIFQSTPSSLKWFCNTYPEHRTALLKSLVKDVEKGVCTPEDVKQYRHDFPELTPLFDKPVGKSRSTLKK
jgi:hypothetical protein